MSSSTLSDTQPPTQAPSPHTSYIEDRPAGYPRLAGFVSAHPSLYLFRRFLRLRARLIHRKQDALIVLESQLDQMDRDEPKKLFLGTIRGDDNTSRHRLLDTISISLNDYDNFVESTERAMARAFPKARDLANLQNWVDNTASLPFEETSYLRDEQDDLFSLSAAGRDEVLRALEGHLEDATFHVQRIMRKSSPIVSRDENVRFTKDSHIRALAQAALAFILVIFLVLPVVVLACLSQLTARLVAMTVFLAAFIITLLLLVQAKPGETFMGSVAYAAVLIVFLSNKDLIEF